MLLDMFQDDIDGISDILSWSSVRSALFKPCSEFFLVITDLGEEDGLNFHPGGARRGIYPKKHVIQFMTAFLNDTSIR